jgi:hypothetical protein
MATVRENWPVVYNAGMNRRARFIAAYLTMAALLFAPFAAAAHACPFMGDGAAMQASGDRGAADEAPPCASHCNDEGAAADLAKFVSSAAPAPVSFPRIAAPEAPVARLPLARPGDFLADPSPPLTRFTVLRI